MSGPFAPPAPRDTTPPEFFDAAGNPVESLPDLVLEAESADGAVVTFDLPTARDSGGGTFFVDDLRLREVVFAEADGPWH